jgi:hypothetical protein
MGNIADIILELNILIVVILKQAGQGTTKAKKFAYVLSKVRPISARVQGLGSCFWNTYVEDLSWKNIPQPFDWEM